MSTPLQGGSVRWPCRTLDESFLCALGYVISPISLSGDVHINSHPLVFEGPDFPVVHLADVCITHRWDEP
jgi:hypothetical protein